MFFEVVPARRRFCVPVAFAPLFSATVTIAETVIWAGPSGERARTSSAPVSRMPFFFKMPQSECVLTAGK